MPNRNLADLLMQKILVPDSRNDPCLRCGKFLVHIPLYDPPIEYECGCVFYLAVAPDGHKLIIDIIVCGNPVP